MMHDDGTHRPSEANIVALVQRYLDGELTPDQQSSLFDLLNRDERTQRLFVRDLMQAAYLHELLAQERSTHAETISNGDAGGLTSSNGLSAVDLAASILPTPLETSGDGDVSSLTSGWSQLRGWLTGRTRSTFVIVLLLAIAGFVWLCPNRGERPLATRSVERIDAPDRPTAREVFDPRSIRIDGGSAKVTLPKVGYMLVDGPADVELISPLRAKLNRGRIRVRVTEKSGRGFVVATPDGDVVDLSTEFGLNVVEGKKTDVVVFDGAVDLHVGKAKAGDRGHVERLIGGEGVAFNKRGKMDRVVSIMTGNVATFLADEEAAARRDDAVIVKVIDNLRSGDTKKFYEIVPKGFGEDVLAYADRPGHEWNGLTKKGLPKYLIGADYVKTFSDDDMRADVAIRVWVSRPAKLYVIYDSRLKPPKWLGSSFRKLKESVGMDLGPWPTIGHPVCRGVGPGNQINHSFGVWERIVKKPGIVALGGNGTRNVKGRRATSPYMYGIAAVAIDATENTTRTASR